MIGQTISHYRIVEKLGEGGMGVVYKAEDLKLKRTVAIKFLPKSLSVHGEERERFELEAQAASALNHPNVATIYEIDEADGETFIVMEHVDGQTVRQLKRGLPIRQIVDIGIQIGEGLAAAHEKGIVHRDIKAENVMVRKDGRVQIMDFGLAKLRGVSKLTKAGSTIGTIAYMSPEQVEGVETDHRTDIFSLGVLLYELLTGELPFKAAHEAAVMYEIVNVNPPGISSVRPDVEPELERIVMKCLEKDREDRYQSVKDVAVDLKHFKRDSEGRRIERRTPQPDVRGQVSQPSEEIRPIHPGRMPRWMKVAVPAVLVVAVAVVVLLLLRPSAKVSDEWVFRPLQLPFTTVGYPGLSADGNWIAFPATDANNVTEIYYMHASGGDPRKLTNDSLWKYTADISPDGSQIVYTRGSSRRELSFPLQILTISTLGGGSTRIAEAGNGPRWSPDGSSIAYIARGPMQGIGLWVMNSDGRNKRLVLEDSLGGRVSLAWSPDGKSIAWLRSFRGEADVYQEIIIRDLESGKERQLTFDKKNIDEVYWMPQGEIIFSSNRNGPSNLWAISSSGGTPLQITKGPGPDLGIKASRDGKRILYLQQSTFGSIWVGDLQGMFSRQITPDDQTVVSAAFSPDGRQIAYVVDDPDPIKQRRYFYLVDLGSRSRRQLTMEGERVEDFVWSPDGRKVAYTIHVSSEIDSMHNVAIFDVSEPSKKISVGNGRVIGWLRDGVSLNVVWNQTSWRVPMSGGTTERLFEDSTVVFPSPDGTKLAIIDSRHDRRGLWIKTKDKESKRFLDRPLAGGGRWLSDSKRFAFPHGDEIWILSIETGKIQPYPWKNPEAVSPSDLSQDGAQTVFVKQRMNAKLILIDNFH